MLEVWLQISHGQPPHRADGLRLAGQLAGSSTASEGGKEHCNLQGWNNQRTWMPSSCVPVTFTTSRSWRMICAFAQPNRLGSGDLYKGVAWVDNPQSVLSWHAGPVVHIQHVRCAGLVCSRYDMRTRLLRLGKGSALQMSLPELLLKMRLRTIMPASNIRALYTGAHRRDRLSKFRHARRERGFLRVEEAQEERHHDLPQYGTNRDDRHTGHRHHTPWKDALDDSLESYLQK